MCSSAVMAASTGEPLAVLVDLRRAPATSTELTLQAGTSRAEVTGSEN
jgi:hypothetical protein